MILEILGRFARGPPHGAAVPLQTDRFRRSESAAEDSLGEKLVAAVTTNSVAALSNDAIHNFLKGAAGVRARARQGEVQHETRPPTAMNYRSRSVRTFVR